jgi:hypothetical protein
MFEIVNEGNIQVLEVDNLNLQRHHMARGEDEFFWITKEKMN